MIFVLIAGTYTPICVYVLDDSLGPALLRVVWGGALAAAAIELRPTTYAALGVVAVLPSRSAGSVCWRCRPWLTGSAGSQPRCWG